MSYLSWAMYHSEFGVKILCAGKDTRKVFYVFLVYLSLYLYTNFNCYITH